MSLSEAMNIKSGGLSTIVDILNHTALSIVLYSAESFNSQILKESLFETTETILPSLTNNAFLSLHCPPSRSPWGYRNTGQFVNQSPHSVSPLCSSTLHQSILHHSPAKSQSTPTDLVTNSYYDTQCQDYAGYASPTLDEVVGGPYGSQSMLWVSATDECSDTCGRKYLLHSMYILKSFLERTDSA